MEQEEQPDKPDPALNKIIVDGIHIETIAFNVKEKVAQHFKGLSPEH